MRVALDYLTITLSSRFPFYLFTCCLFWLFPFSLAWCVFALQSITRAAIHPTGTATRLTVVCWSILMLMVKPDRLLTSRMHRSRNTRPCSVSRSLNPSLSKKRVKVFSLALSVIHLDQIISCAFTVSLYWLWFHFLLSFLSLAPQLLHIFLPPSSQLFFNFLSLSHHSFYPPVSQSLVSCPLFITASTFPPIHQERLISVWHFVIFPSYFITHTHTH